MYKEKGNVKKAAAASAVIVAHHYEVLADYYKQVGQNVTAKELMAKRIGLGEEQSGAGRLYNQQQEINPIIKKQIDAVRKKYEGTDQWMKAPDGTDTKLSEEQWLYAYTDCFKEKYGDWEKSYEVNKFYDSKSVIADTDAIKATPEMKVRQAAIKWAEDNLPKESIPTKFGKVEVDAVSVRDSLAHGYGAKKLAAITALVDGLKQGSFIKELADLDGHDVMNAYFCFKMKFKDEDNQVVFCKVRKDANKTRLYIHEVYDLDKIKSTSLQTAAQEKPELGRGNALYTSILAQFFNADNTLSIQTLENGEPNFAQLDEKEFYMQRNAQKVDVYSANFKAWFGDWKKGEVPKELLDKNGEPRVFYHQTSTEFDTFDIRHKGAGTYDSAVPFGVFLKPTDTNIGLAGNTQMPLFIRMKNPIRFANRYALTSYLRLHVDGYAEAADNIKAVNKEYQKKYDEAEQENREYLQKLRASGLTREQLSEEYYKRKDASKAIMEEWEDADNKARAAAKELLDKYFRDQGYDGVILKQDQGSWGRSTETFIALNNNQVKSAVSNKGKFDINNPNIYIQRAWHGTGAVFNAWDLGYAGTGEGGSAHGWGLYFAQDKIVYLHKMVLFDFLTYRMYNKRVKTIERRIVERS